MPAVAITTVTVRLEDFGSPRSNEHKKLAPIEKQENPAVSYQECDPPHSSLLSSSSEI
jgi:hypothetical protein